MTLYEQLMARDLPTVTCDGRAYVLIGMADRTNCAFAGCFQEAREGETYLDDWEALAIGPDSERYIVRWRFLQVKGQEGLDDDLPWDMAESVRLA